MRKPVRPRAAQAAGSTPFAIVPADVDESAHELLSPPERVRRLAIDKASAVARVTPESLVIGADTLVVLADRVLGKLTAVLASVPPRREVSGKVRRAESR